MKLTDEHSIIWLKDIEDYAWVREIPIPQRNLIYSFGTVYAPDRSNFDPDGNICGVAVDHFNRVVRLFALTREDRFYRRIPSGAARISSIRINQPSKIIGGCN